MFVAPRRSLRTSLGYPCVGIAQLRFPLARTNLWTFEVLAEEGYAYSSSIYPIRHDSTACQMPHAFRFIHCQARNFSKCLSRRSNWPSWNLPCGGGGYFRLLPYAYSKWSIDRLNRHERQASVLYFHPWEIDPDQPRPANLSLKSRVRHYTNLGRMEARLSRLLRDFRWDRMDRVFLPDAETLPS